MSCLAAIAVSVSANAEQDSDYSQEITASDESSNPITIEAAYTGEVWMNRGGIADGERYLDNLDLTAEVDLEQAMGWNGTTIFAYMLYNNGNSLSELAGDALAISNIETGVQAVRLYEAWLEAPIADFANLKVGLYDLNSEFDALETSSLFIGSAHGVGMDIGQTGENGPSIFPVTSLAARLHIDIAEKIALRLAVFDGVPGNPAAPKRTTVKLSDEDGALTIGELDFGTEDRRIIAGAWSYSSDFPHHDGVRTASNNGIYLRGEAALASFPLGLLRGFARLGVAAGAVNQFDRFASAGLTFETNRGDILGAAVAHAAMSDQFRLVNPGFGPAETAFELTYAHAVTDWLQFQPNVQYIVNPSADASIDDAVAVGLRVVIAPCVVSC